MRRLAAWSLAAATGLVIWSAVVEPRFVRLRRVEIPVPGLPAAFDGYRILHLSDFEADGIGTRERQVASISARERPDLIAVTGDLVRKALGTQRAEAVFREVAGLLGSMPAPDGVWFVQGHGESATRRQEAVLRAALEEAGVRGLWDETRSVGRHGASLAMAGVRIHDYGARADWVSGAPGSFTQGPCRRPGYLELPPARGEAARDYEVTGRLRFTSPEDWIGIMVHSNMGAGRDEAYLVLRRDHVPFLGMGARGTDYGESSVKWPRAVGPGRWHAFRVRVETHPDEVRVRARSWQEGDREPAGWDVDSIDRSATRIATGAPGFYAEGPGVKQLADVAVSGYTAGGAWRQPAGNDILRQLRQSAGSGSPMILLSHDPDIFPDAAGLGIQLTLAGHTQGGQVRIPWVGPLVTDTHLGRRFADGLVSLPGGLMFVTRGIGTTRIPIRFLCPPEAVLLTLRTAA